MALAFYILIIKLPVTFSSIPGVPILDNFDSWMGEEFLLLLSFAFNFLRRILDF